MKKAISILFLSIYLLSSTQLKELLKLPILAAHFIEHKQKDASMCFFEFLYMHYASGDVKDADYDKDMKLPFKSAENSNAFVSFYLPVTALKQDFVMHFKEGKQQFPLYHSNYSSACLSAIWQPPRAC